jgi:hypothetical protein
VVIVILLFSVAILMVMMVKKSPWTAQVVLEERGKVMMHRPRANGGYFFGAMFRSCLCVQYPAVEIVTLARIGSKSFDGAHHVADSVSSGTFPPSLQPTA